MIFFEINDSNEEENKLLSQGCHYIDPYNKNNKHYWKFKYITY